MERAPSAAPVEPRVHWPAVIVYFAIACAISWPLFFWRDLRHEAWADWHVPETLKLLLPATGPALGALVAMLIFRKKVPRTFSLGGTSWSRSLLFAGVPAAVVIAIGTGEVQRHLTAIFWVEVHMLYALGIELGWRGFLQDALFPLPRRHRFVLIGVLWSLWHVTTFWDSGLRIASMAALSIGGSFVIGWTVERSRSLIVAAAVHLVFHFSQHLTGKGLFLVAGVSAAAWALLMRSWPDPSTDLEDASYP